MSPVPTPNKTIYIHGDAGGEHLRAEIKNNGEVLLVSHDLAIGRALSHWRERHMVNIPHSVWLKIAEEIKK